MPGYRLDGLQRLAKQHDIQAPTPLLPLPSLTEADVPGFSTTEDSERANQSLLQRKASKEVRKPLLRTKSRLESYEYKNITAELSDAVRSAKSRRRGGSCGIGNSIRGCRMSASCKGLRKGRRSRWGCRMWRPEGLLLSADMGDESYGCAREGHGRFGSSLGCVEMNSSLISLDPSTGKASFEWASVMSHDSPFIPEVVKIESLI